MTDLTSAERRWLDQGLWTVPDGRDRPGRLLGRAQKAVDRWSVETGWVAEGLVGASPDVTVPAQAGGDLVQRSGPGDPVYRAVDRTFRQVEDAAKRWAHLTSDCLLDCAWCGGVSASAVAAQTGVEVQDPADVVDALLGTPTSSTTAWQQAVARAAGWHSVVASQVGGQIVELWRGGAETSVVEDAVSSVEQLGRLMASVAGVLAAWSGRVERRCRVCGGHARPDRGERTCSRCRKARSRARAQQQAGRTERTA